MLASSRYRSERRLCTYLRHRPRGSSKQTPVGPPCLGVGSRDALRPLLFGRLGTSNGRSVARMLRTTSYYIKLQCLHCTYMSVRFFLLIRASWCFAAAAFPICSNSAAVQYGERGGGIPWVLAWSQRTDTSHVSSRSAQRTAQANINCAFCFAQAPGLISPSLFLTPTYQHTCTRNSSYTTSPLYFGWSALARHDNVVLVKFLAQSRFM